MQAPSEITDICMVGMGYVGLTLAVGLAQAGYRVHGIENHAATLACLRTGKPHFKETGLDEKFAEFFTRGVITVQERLEAHRSATAFVITVGTPMGADKQVTMAGIEQVSRAIAAVLKPNDLVILRSTVKLGTTRDVVKPLLDAAGMPYFLAMCPERTVEGHAIEELRNLPQIVGGLDAASTERAATIFRRMTSEIVTVSSLEAAELAKLVCNTQRDLWFAYANEVALMADAVGVNAQEVIHAANHQYPRSRVAKSGLVGGPCLEKDAYILAAGLETMTPHIVMAGRQLNEAIVPHGVARVVAALEKQHRTVQNIRSIAVLGLAFKGEPETDDIRGSLAIPLIAQLSTVFPQATIRGYDPVASVETSARWGIAAENSIDAALAGADIVLIQNNHAAFRNEALKPYLSILATRAILYDFWGCVAPHLTRGSGVYHLGLGFDYGA